MFEANRFRVERFSSAGAFKVAFGKDVVIGGGTGFERCTVAAACKRGVTGSEAGAFRSPNGLVAPASDDLTVDGAGTVYVADRENNRVQVFRADGTFRRGWGLNVDPDNADVGFEICITTCQGGGESGLGGALITPTGISAAPSADVYTADQVAQRIQRFTCAASTVAFSAASVSVAEGAGSATLTVQRTGDVGCGGSVQYATTPGTATPADYTSGGGTLTFEPGGDHQDRLRPDHERRAPRGRRDVHRHAHRPGGPAAPSACRPAPR